MHLKLVVTMADLEILLQQEISELRGAVQNAQNKARDTTYEKALTGHSAIGRINLRKRGIFKGHLAKVYALQWGSDSRHLLSASQDGKLIVWDGYTHKKVKQVCYLIFCCAIYSTIDCNG